MSGFSIATGTRSAQKGLPPAARKVFRGRAALESLQCLRILARGNRLPVLGGGRSWHGESGPIPAVVVRNMKMECFPQTAFPIGVNLRSPSRRMHRAFPSASETRHPPSVEGTTSDGRSERAKGLPRVILAGSPRTPHLQPTLAFLPVGAVAPSCPGKEGMGRSGRAHARAGELAARQV